MSTQINKCLNSLEGNSNLLKHFPQENVCSLDQSILQYSGEYTGNIVFSPTNWNYDKTEMMSVLWQWVRMMTPSALCLCLCHTLLSLPHLSLSDIMGCIPASLLLCSMWDYVRLISTVITWLDNMLPLIYKTRAKNSQQQRETVTFSTQYYDSYDWGCA